MPGPPSRVLLVRAGALGDLLLLRDTVASLGAAGHEVLLLAPDAGGALVGHGLGDVGCHFRWDAPETTVFLAGGTAPSWMDGVSVVVCYTRDPAIADRFRSVTGTVLVRDPAPPPGEHSAAWLAHPVETLGVAVRRAPPCLPDAAEASRIEVWRRRLPPRFVAIHPGSGSRGKNWPKERFWATAARLSSEKPWLACLGPAEQDWRAPEGAVVARDLPPRELGALLSHCGVFVGNDSGAAHLAAAWGAATVAIFGPTDPRQWAPVGPRVAVRRAPGGRLEDLDVDAVVEAAVRIREV